MRYEYQSVKDDRWGNGTGWLIRPDVLVTAGHCAYDWNRGLGRCMKIKAYIGYNGISSVGTRNVQFRQGKKVVTTDPWLKSSTKTSNDVAFIQLDEPFEGVRPYKFCTTPMKGNATLGVVGYPGDKRHNNDPNRELAEQMYEEFSKTDWSLTRSGDKMLEYRIDTYKGNSLLVCTIIVDAKN